MYYFVKAIKDGEIFVKATEDVKSALDSRMQWCFAKANVIEFFAVEDEIKYFEIGCDSIFSSTLSESRELTIDGDNEEIEKRLRLHHKFYVEEI